MVPDIAGDRCRSGYWVVLSERSGAPRSFLEVGDKDAIGGADTEEVVHVDVAALGLRPAFGDERDRVGNAAVAGVGTDAGAFPLEPGLDGESGCAEAWGRAEGHVIVGAIEVKRSAGLGSGRRRGSGGRRSWRGCWRRGGRWC